MSKIAKKPLMIPEAVELKIEGNTVSAKGKQGENSMDVHPDILIKQEGDAVTVEPQNAEAMPLAGTMRSLLGNLVTGVSEGYEKKLELVGVGYRAQAKGQNLDLQLGFSHNVNFPLPEGVKAQLPSQTEIVLQGVDKQAVNQVAAEIRALRPPEPYKGKGVRYADEHILRKEAKKK